MNKRKNNQITKGRFIFKDFQTIVNYFCFHGNSDDEYHITIVPLKNKCLTEQLECIEKTYERTLENLQISGKSCVFRRFFCSDLPNQYEKLKNHPLISKNDGCNVSIVSQPSYPLSKISLWSYHISDKEPLNFSQSGIVRGSLIHFWDTGIFCRETEDVYSQTECILSRYKEILGKRNMNLAANLIRTWFFVQNIDANYKNFVEARREFFAQNGLKPETHFIASTGVEGLSYDIRAKVFMDAYSIYGIQDSQIEFLRAPDYISPTHIYGVTFERGTVVKYADRRHIFISGTASINNKGEIVYQNDVINQLNKTLENIEILLNQAEASFDNVGIFIVYVRDMADAEPVYIEMKKRFKKTPMILVVANVCRPGWLVEIECQAIKSDCNDNMPAF